MRIRGKSINLFLMDGTASGRINVLWQLTGLAYKIPRTELDKCKERDDSAKRCLFSFGISDKTGENVVYIGQAGVRKWGRYPLRLQEHKRNPIRIIGLRRLFLLHQTIFLAPRNQLS